MVILGDGRGAIRPKGWMFMSNQYTAVIEKDRGWFVAHCVEIPGIAGRGPTVDAAKESLTEAILLVLQRKAEQDGEEADTPTPVMH